MTHESCAAAADWLAWAAGMSGVVGSLLLVQPLFFLLRYREAIETIDIGKTNPLPADFQARLDRAKTYLKNASYQDRDGWKRWAVAGTTCLAASLVLLLGQGAFLLC
jgi:hypothetical protein